jgi:hypothetical protein
VNNEIPPRKILPSNATVEWSPGNPKLQKGLSEDYKDYSMEVPLTTLNAGKSVSNKTTSGTGKTPLINISGESMNIGPKFQNTSKSTHF